MSQVTHSGPICQLRSAVARDLTQFESDMLVYPRLCNVCLDGRQESTRIIANNGHREMSLVLVVKFFPKKTSPGH